MATQILPVAAGAATSLDFTFSTDTAVFLKDANGGSIARGAMVYVEAKDDAGQYTLVSELTSDDNNGVLPAGIYRFRRKANGITVGVSHA